MIEPRNHSEPLVIYTIRFFKYLNVQRPHTLLLFEVKSVFCCTNVVKPIVTFIRIVTLIIMLKCLSVNSFQRSAHRVKRVFQLRYTLPNGTLTHALEIRSPRHTRLFRMRLDVACLAAIFAQKLFLFSFSFRNQSFTLLLFRYQTRIELLPYVKPCEKKMVSLDFNYYNSCIHDQGRPFMIF